MVAVGPESRDSLSQSFKENQYKLKNKWGRKQSYKQGIMGTKQQNPARSEWKWCTYIQGTWSQDEKQAADWEQAAAESVEQVGRLRERE